MPFHLFSFRRPVDRLPVDTADICEDSVLNQLPEADRCISTDVRSQIEMFAAFSIGLDSIVIMTMNVQAP